MYGLYEAFSAINTKQEFTAWLNDLCTPAEIKALTERWQMAQLLYEGRLSQKAIAEKLGASITTVTRVARFLNHENYRGYQTVLGRVQAGHNHTHHA
jgi:TrpR-related protein YerC/YecD